MRKPTRTLVLLALALAAAAPRPTAAQQPPAGFDLFSLDIPEGFLDLRDVVMTARQGGGVTVTATTTLLEAETRFLLASSPPAVAGGSRRLTVGLKPDDWSLTESIPPLSNPALDGLTLSNVGLVLAGEEIAASASELTPEEYAFYREIFGRDDFDFRLQPGINLIAAIPLGELEEGNPLRLALDALGVEKADILLQGTLGRSLSTIGRGVPTASAIRDLYLRAELPPVRPPGSPDWFHSGQLALELTGDPSVRLAGELTVEVEGDVLVFFVATRVARTGMSLAGGLLAEEGWEEPFGIEWMIVRRVVLKLGITPAGSVQLGFGGDLVIGEKDMAVDVAVAVSPAGVPTNFIFQGESESGFGLADLVELQGRMAAARDAAAGFGGGGPGAGGGAGSGGDGLGGGGNGVGGAGGGALIPLDRLPQIEFRDVGLKFAPRPEPDLGVERGMAIKGRLWLQTSPRGELADFAGVDVGVGDEGLWVRGDIGAFTLGPLVWEEAELDLTATREAQHFLIRGEVELLATRQLLDVSLEREAFRFRSETRLFDLFTADLDAHAAFDLRRPAFQVHGVAQNDFGEAVLPLVMEGFAGFAETGDAVLEQAGDALAELEAVLADREATLQEVRAAVETQRSAIRSELRSAQDRAASARRTMDSRKRSLDSAVRAWRDTPSWQVARRAERAAVVVTRRSQYGAARTAYLARAAQATAVQQIYDALPPVDESLQVMAARAALERLRERVRESTERLGRLSSGYGRLLEALESGQPPMTLRTATFRADLERMVQGQAMAWTLAGTFTGRPFTLERELDFADVGGAAAQIVESLLGR